MILDTEQIKSSEEYLKYLKAKQDLSDVSPGGIHHASCSFMDISVRDDRFENRKKNINRNARQVSICWVRKGR